MNIEDKAKCICKFNLSEKETEKLLMDEIAQDNLFKTLELTDIGVSIDDLGLTLEDIDNASNMHKIKDEELEQENFAKAKTVNLYRYVSYGANGYNNDIGENTRSFCKNLVRRTRLSLMRYTDILKLNGSNKGMGLNGANVYNVFKWRGGVNCKHIWVKYKYDIENQKLVEAPISEQPNQSNKGAVPNA
jgi:hypothetical protein